MTWHKRITFIVALLIAAFDIEARPKVGIVIIIDQFAYHEWQWLHKKAQYGFKTLRDKGVNFIDAHHLHGAPVTGAGHASISTNSLPYYHGIVNNEWYNNQQQKVVCDKIEDRYCLNNLMIDTLNDQLMLQNRQAHTYCISLKPRASLLMAGRLGHAYWFESTGKEFKFNNERATLTPYLQEVAKRFDIDTSFAKSIASNKLLLDSGLETLKFAKQQQDQEPILIWLSLSALDKVGHHDGPWNQNVHDMLLALDKDIGEFIDQVEELYPSDEILWALSADHGVQPVVEEVQEKGYTPSHRIIKEELVQKIQDAVGAESEIQVTGIRTPFVYLTNNNENNLDAIKNALKTIPGIVNVFSTHELEINATHTYKERLFKNQLYPGRTGQLVIELAPYVLMSDKKEGTKHNTPYDYNAHVPLIIRWDNHLEHSTQAERVWAPQISATLAHLFGIPLPSASLFGILPGISAE